MPTVFNARLTLSTVGADTTINVTYDVIFSTLERHLAGLGLEFPDSPGFSGKIPSR
jgi:hypothetical protein